ncbi:hypothetical protein Tco_1433051 [Tanacetum coccineum]
MSSTSSAITYTSVYTNSEPGRVFWGADGELSDGGSPRVIVYRYDGLPIQLVASPSPDYAPGPEHPPSPVEVPYVPKPEYPEYLVPSDDEVHIEDQPLPADASPVALSLGYVADSDLEEDFEEDHVDYPADGGDDDNKPSDDDDDDDDHDMDDEDEEPFEDDKEKEEHLAPADSPAAPVIDLVPSAEDIEAFKTDEVAPTHVPSPRRHTARMSVRPQTPVPLPSEEEVERLLALPIPPPSPLTPLSSPLPQITSPPLPPPPYIYHHLYEVGGSSTAAPRPTGGHGADYGFIGTVDAKEQDTQDIYALIEDTQDRKTQIYQRVDILAEDRYTAIHYELQAYRTDTQMQDYRIASHKSLTMTLIAHVSSLQGWLSAVLGQIQALQARDQTHAGDREGGGSSA